MSPEYHQRPIHGLDLSPLERMEVRQGRAIQTRVDPSGLLAEGAALIELDLVTADREDPFRRVDAAFTIARDGVLSGFAGWFEARLSDSVWLDTGPRSPETHWSQTWMAVEPRPVRAGERLEVSVELARDPLESRYLSVEVELGDDLCRFVVE